MRSKLTVRDFSFRIAESIERAHKKFNEGRPRREQYDPCASLSTSVGWVRSSSIRELDEAEGMEKRRRNLLKKMREEHRLIEIADSDTQEHVKRLGKSGYLEFEECKNLPADEEEASRMLQEWMEKVQWFAPLDVPRSPRIKFRYIPNLRGKK